MAKKKQITREITVKSPKIGDSYYFLFAGGILYGTFLKYSKSLSKHYNEKWLTMVTPNRHKDMPDMRYPVSIRNISKKQEDLKN